MYFWNTKALSRDIKNNQLSEKEWKNYYLAGSIFVTLSMYLVALRPASNINAVLIEAILMVVILIFGVSMTFKTHQANNNCEASYIAKMTALSFPLMIKLFTLSFVVGLVFGIAEGTDLSSEFTHAWMYLLLSVSVQLLLFWRLNVHLSSINK